MKLRMTGGAGSIAFRCSTILKQLENRLCDENKKNKETEEGIKHGN